MKSDAKRLAQVIRTLAGIRVVCLYGDDSESIRACARRLVIAAAGSADDPFRVAECDGEQRETIEAALASPGLSGGRAVVWVRHATERLLPIVGQTLSGAAEALLILEYGTSTGRSRVRAQVEQSAHGCVVACYTQANATSDAIATVLQAWNVAASEDSVALLAARAEAAHCPGQVAGLAAALFAGQDGRLNTDDIYGLAAISPDSQLDADLNAGLNAGLCGDVAALDAGVATAVGDVGGIAVLRAALQHLQRLRALSLQLGEGRTMAEAGRALRPPLFFREEKSTAAALRAWTAEQLGASARVVWEAERASKAAGVPQGAVCREVLAGLPRLTARRQTFRRD